MPLSPMDAALAALTWPRRTSRLVLRPLTVPDADVAVSYRSDPEVTRYLRHGRLTREQVVARHRERVRRMQPGASDPMVALAVEDATGMVGDCMLDLKRAPDGWAGWIGYALAPAAQGKGYATEVARDLVDLAALLPVRDLYATTRRANIASQHVLAKAGFTPASPAPDEDSLLFHRSVGPRRE